MRLTDRLTAALPARPAPRRVMRWTAGVVLTRAVLFAVYNVLGDLQADVHGTLARRLVDELSAAATALPAIALSALAVSHLPLAGARWRQHLVPLAGVFAGFSVSHTVVTEALRWVVYPAIGEVRELSGATLSLAIAHEMPNDLFFFALIVGCTELWHFWWRASERERRESELQRSLAESQLTTLRLQLQPHFLFNALNTVSATMYEDPRAADAMLGELAELLRASLRTHQRDEVPLREEVTIAERYVRLQRARFGDRLRVTFEVPVELAEVRVPVFVLQPLIENAVRHGGVERRGRGEIRVRARAEQGMLMLEVWDDGDGSPASPPGTGLGLGATRERLRLLYGEAARFDAGPAQPGWRVRLAIPARGKAA